MKTPSNSDTRNPAQDDDSEKGGSGRRSDKGPARPTIPGGAGAAGQVPIKGDDSKFRDDPFRDDSAEHGE